MAAVGYGGLDRALARMKDEPWMPVAFAGYFAGVAGAWVGGAVAPGRDSRRPVLTSSFRGGAAGAVTAAAAGLLAGWGVWRQNPESELVLRVPLALGVLLGVPAGLLAGRSGRRAGRRP